jgi:hypothetical protein
MRYARGGGLTAEAGAKRRRTLTAAGLPAPLWHPAAHGGLPPDRYLARRPAAGELTLSEASCAFLATVCGGVSTAGSGSCALSLLSSARASRWMRSPLSGSLPGWTAHGPALLDAAAGPGWCARARRLLLGHAAGYDLLSAGVCACQRGRRLRGSC